MTESAKESRAPDGYEPVHVELEWYDGPRRGLADVSGKAHYFQAAHDYHETDGPDDEYFVWPADETAVAMEHEQWAIFARWNARYEAGEATVDTHPGQPGTDSRFDELEALLAPRRVVPDRPRRLVATWHWDDRSVRYPNGPLYWVRWHEPGE